MLERDDECVLHQVVRAAPFGDEAARETPQEARFGEQFLSGDGFGSGVQDVHFKTDHFETATCASS